jgi:pimeloyl-ACP methyl ester carboxylesterase
MRVLSRSEFTNMVSGALDYNGTRSLPMKIGRSVYLGIPAAVLAGSIVFAYSSYRCDIAAAEARVSSGSEVVDTPCGRIEYAVVGQGAPLLLVHGAGGGFDQGLEFGRPLAERGFMVVAMSRFGYLRTPMPADASPAAQADAHACLLDALKLPRAAILGGSAGAPSTIEFCLRHAARCSAMVLLVPAFFPPGATQARAQPSFMLEALLGSDFLFWLNMKLARDAVLERLFATPVSDFENATPEEQERILRILWGVLPLSERRKGLWNDFGIVASAPRYELERIAVPTLVVSIENDLFRIFQSSRSAAERIPGARFVSFPTGGHLWAGRQKEVVSETTKFLGDTYSRPSTRAGA